MSFWLDVTATRRSEPGQGESTALLSRNTLLYYENLPSGLSRTGIQVAGYPIPRLHSYFSRNRLRRFREKYGWVLWLDVANTCRSEPGQARRKRSELKLYTFSKTDGNVVDLSCTFSAGFANTYDRRRLQESRIELTRLVCNLPTLRAFELNLLVKLKTQPPHSLVWTC